jgi:hypothetical protein
MVTPQLVFRGVRIRETMEVATILISMRPFGVVRLMRRPAVVVHGGAVRPPKYSFILSVIETEPAALCPACVENPVIVVRGMRRSEYTALALTKSVGADPI